MVSDLLIALFTIFGTVASVTGVVLYVFNGTKNLINKMHETQQEMHKTQQEIHKTQQEMHKTQQKILLVLEKGFGDLSKDMKEIKDKLINREDKK